MKQDVFELEQLAEMLHRSLERSNELMLKSSNLHAFVITEFAVDIHVFIHVREDDQRCKLVYQLPTQEQLLNDKLNESGLKLSRIHLTVRPSVNIQNQPETEG
jgi:hypothetical protein